jgi:hypothetical protein
MKASSRSADSSDLLNREVVRGDMNITNKVSTGVVGVPVDYRVQVKFSSAPCICKASEHTQNVKSVVGTHLRIRQAYPASPPTVC